MELQNTNIEPTYENFVMAYYSGDAETFFSFGELLEKRVMNKYFRQLETEKKSVKEFCESAKKKYANIETGYLQQNLASL